jgi:hypothetical protein
VLVREHFFWDKNSPTKIWPPKRDTPGSVVRSQNVHIYTIVFVAYANKPCYN